MAEHDERMGIFPLPIFLLAGGITTLRIFEPRYTKLVSEASQQNGFVMSFYDSTKPFKSSEFGTWVDIIDFSAPADGLLNIKVRAKSLVALNNFAQDDDKLHRASIIPIEHWSHAPHYSHNSKLAEVLKNIIDTHQELNAYYPTAQYHDIAWVCARYIELLPLSPNKKQQLIFEQTFEQCQNFLHTVITGK